MIDNNQLRDVLYEKLEEATSKLLPQVEMLSVSSHESYGKQYSSATLDLAINDVKRWQRGLLEFFISTFGERDTHTVRFNETISDTDFIHSYDAKRSLRRALMDSVTYIEAIIPYVDQINLNKVMMSEDEVKKSPKLFISHSSKDILFVEELVSLLEFMGFKENTMFCSSIAGYGIPLGKNIFDHLLEQFLEHNLFVLFIHSPRYYDSSVSLNEMGAAWVLKHKYFSVLTKDMDFSKMSGVVSSQEIAIKVDTADAKLRLNELKDNLVSFFSIQELNESRWETQRDKFLKNVTE